MSEFDEEKNITIDTFDLAKSKGYISKSIPSQTVLKRWLREVHLIDVTVIFYERGYLHSTKKRPYKGNNYLVNFDDEYEVAMEKGLKKGLDLIV